MSPDLDFLASTAGAWWVFWVAVAGWLIFLGRRLIGHHDERRWTARDELGRRLDDGEISPQDYERRLRLLGDGGKNRQ